MRPSALRQLHQRLDDQTTIGRDCAIRTATTKRSAAWLTQRRDTIDEGI